MVLPAAAFAAVLLLTALAGWGFARHALRGLVDAEHRLLAAVLCGTLAVAAGTAIGAAAGTAGTFATAGAAAALVAGLALLWNGGGCELREAVRVSGARWLGWTAVAAAFTWVWYVRQIGLDDDAVHWRGTAGWELWPNIEVARSLDAGRPLRWTGPWAPDTVNYHFATHAAALGWAKLSGAPIVVVFARFLPVPLVAMALESHRALLRTWFPAGRALIAAAVLPLAVADLDVWARLVGVAPVPEFEHRLAHSFAVSPSFVLGTAHTVFALALLLRAGNAGRLAVRDAVGLGVVAGLSVATKLPSFVILALAAAGVAPWLVGRCGGRAVAAGVAATVVAGLAAGAACFPSMLGLAEREFVTGGTRWAFLQPFHAAGDGAGAWTIVLLAAWWIVQAVGPRALRLGDAVRAARRDPSLVALLVPLAAAVVLPLVVEVAPASEEKYFMRCGGVPALLFTGAVVAGDLARRRPRAFLDAAVIAAFCAGTTWYARPAPFEASLTRAEIEAVAAAGDATLDASVGLRLGHAVGALSGVRLHREGDVAPGSRRARVAAVGTPARSDERTTYTGPTLSVLVRE